MTQNDENRKSLVDRSQGRLLPAPRAKRPNQREMHYPVRCANPACSNVRWLTACAAERAENELRMCRRCQASIAGKKGQAVTSARYGQDFLLQAVRRSQLSNPSSYEILVEGWITTLCTDHGIRYSAQVPFSATDSADVGHNFLIDFVLHTPSGDIAVEVNGFHHKKYRAERDYWLALFYPGEVVFIDTDTIDSSPDEVRDTLRRLITYSNTLGATDERE
jgi:hypothetical protein